MSFRMTKIRKKYIVGNIFLKFSFMKIFSNYFSKKYFYLLNFGKPELFEFQSLHLLYCTQVLTLQHSNFFFQFIHGIEGEYFTGSGD